MEFSTCFRGNMWWYLMETTFRLVCALSIIHNPRVQNSSWLLINSSLMAMSRLTWSVTAAWKAFLLSFVVCYISSWWQRILIVNCRWRMDGSLTFSMSMTGRFCRSNRLSPEQITRFFLCCSLYYAAFKLCLNYSNYSMITLSCSCL